MKTDQRVSGSKIRAARENAGMSQAALAYAIRTGERNIRRWESEANTPRIEAVASIAEVLGVRIDELFADQEGEVASADPFRGSRERSSQGDSDSDPRGAEGAEVAA